MLFALNKYIPFCLKFRLLLKELRCSNRPLGIATLSNPIIPATTRNPCNGLLGFVSVAEQLKNNTWHPLEGLDPSLPETFEELFKGLPNYTIITFGTMSGVEGGCVMFKHTINAFSYGSFFNKFFGPCLIRRKPDETWEYQTTLGV